MTPHRIFAVCQGIRRIVLLWALALSALALAGPAAAQTLRIGLAAEVSSIDPHYLNIAPNVAFASHLFDTLVSVDADGHLIPGLALTWKAVDATTWELALRRGVRFHDGSEFTAQDAIFSLERPAKLTGSPGSFVSSTRQIASLQAPDPYTLRIKTRAPYGPLPLDLSTIFIVSSKAARNATTDDFNRGPAAIGTGPFKLLAFRRGDAIELVRNDAYWDGKPHWEKVILRMMGNGATRTAALLAGDVDAIESVPSADVYRLKSNTKFRMEQKVSWRTIFWHLDQAPRPSPQITDKAGKPLAVNPLADIRVRRAISKSINRPAMAERTMEGLALPASNLVAPGIFGYNEELKVDGYDPKEAKRLLAEAGYPDGFAITIHGPSNRYQNDELIVQTMAQFLNRIGIAARVETLPVSVYFGRAKKGDFSMALLGWGTLAGDFGLRTLLGTPDPQSGWGSWNWSHYSNAQMDRLVQASLASVDQAKRERLTREASALALADQAVVLLHHQYATWAMRRGLRYTARTDEFTFAHQFAPEPQPARQP